MTAGFKVGDRVLYQHPLGAAFGHPPVAAIVVKLGHVRVKVEWESTRGQSWCEARHLRRAARASQ